MTNIQQLDTYARIIIIKPKIRRAFCFQSFGRIFPSFSKYTHRETIYGFHIFILFFCYGRDQYDKNHIFLFFLLLLLLFFQPGHKLSYSINQSYMCFECRHTHTHSFNWHKIIENSVCVFSERVSVLPSLQLCFSFSFIRKTSLEWFTPFGLWHTGSTIPSSRQLNWNHSVLHWTRPIRTGSIHWWHLVARTHHTWIQHRCSIRIQVLHR